MDRIVKGIWIPIEIWQNRSLSWNEKILLMEIDSFTAKDHECYISNEYIAELLGVSVSWASKCLSHLLELGLVRVVKFDGRKRYVESTIQFKADLNESSMQDGTKVPYTNNNEYINNNNSPYKKGSSRFQKPTIEEIRQYCLEEGYNVDAEQFFDFYESKGWLVGKSPMKDWKAALRTWEHRKPETTRTTFSPRQKKSVFEQNLEVMDQMFGTDMHSKVYGKKEVYDEQ